VRKLAVVAFVFLVTIFPAHICQAVVYPFEIFTDNGGYYDNPGWDLYVDVWNGGSQANFTFYNNSSFDCSIAQIYFDDGTILGIDEVINSIDPGPPKVTYTSFNNTGPSPGNLPGANLLVPPFVADREFSIGAVSPPPWKGVNNGDILNEWVTISFQLSADLATLLSELNDGTLRVGLHVINLPDGSSESAVLVPEPATVLLLGLGALTLLRRRRRA
jgi:hypothetical protein